MYVGFRKSRDTGVCALVNTDEFSGFDRAARIAAVANQMNHTIYTDYVQIAVTGGELATWYLEEASRLHIERADSERITR